MERMNDQEYSHLGRSGENWKYSRLDGRDGRLEILKVRWKWMKDQEYSQVSGNDKRLEILKVRWKG